MLLVGLLAAIQPGGADPRLGTWTLVSAQASLDPPNRLVIEPQHEGLHVTMSGETHVDFTTGKAGHPAAAPGNLGFDQVELHRINKRQAEVQEDKGGVKVATIQERVSNDGKELTTTEVRKGHPDRIAVWVRSGGKKAIGDPFAGEWTQDLGKSLLRQAQVVKFENDGRGGVRFEGDSSYDARFDGKPYDVRNSRNDTVALQMVDARTVDAVYRRDEQITQRDRWQVSADGRTMTVTTSGTLETGQRFTEKLQFKKQ